MSAEGFERKAGVTPSVASIIRPAPDDPYYGMPCLAGLPIVRGMAVPEMLSRESYGAINGMLAAPSLVARAAAPAAAAALWKATGSYGGVLVAIFAGAALTAIGFWIAAAMSARMLRRPKG